MMWLNVAEYNPNAIAFYLSYGFKKTSVSVTGGGKRAREGRHGRETGVGYNPVAIAL
jgi:hypothetical protein